MKVSNSVSATLNMAIGAAILALAVTVTGPAYADTQASPAAGAAAPTVKNVMSQMGDEMKVLVNALVKNQPVADADLLAAADALPGLAAQAAKILPTQLADSQGHALPGQDAAVAQYQDLMGQLVAALTDLDQSIKAGDKAGAKTILLNKVGAIQKQGHTLFKPPHD